jgi:hypothetical protein
MYDVWSNRYTPAAVWGGWGSKMLIERNNAGAATRPHIVHTGNGEFRAVWQHSDGNFYHVWENRFTP